MVSGLYAVVDFGELQTLANYLGVLLSDARNEGRKATSDGDADMISHWADVEAAAEAEYDAACAQLLSRFNYVPRLAVVQ